MKKTKRFKDYHEKPLLLIKAVKKSMTPDRLANAAKVAAFFPHLKGVIPS